MRICARTDNIKIHTPLHVMIHLHICDSSLNRTSPIQVGLFVLLLNLATGPGTLPPNIAQECMSTLMFSLAMCFHSPGCFLETHHTFGINLLLSFEKRSWTCATVVMDHRVRRCHAIRHLVGWPRSWRGASQGGLERRQEKQVVSSGVLMIGESTLVDGRLIGNTLDSWD